MLQRYNLWQHLATSVRSQSRSGISSSSLPRDIMILSHSHTSASSATALQPAVRAHHAQRGPVVLADMKGAMDGAGGSRSFCESASILTAAGANSAAAPDEAAAAAYQSTATPPCSEASTSPRPARKKQKHGHDSQTPAPASRRAARQLTLTGRPPPNLDGSGSSSRGRKPLQAAEGAEGLNDLGEGAKVWYHPGAWSAADSAQLVQRLQEEVRWEHKQVFVMGRHVMQPRLIAYMADNESLTYTYSHLHLDPASWSPAVAEIKERLEELAGTTFNSCLLNLYRSGGDHMGWHSDNEPLYGPKPVIGSASFGATRDFMLRNNKERDRKLRFPLGSGDALIMAGTTQDFWMHNVPKRATVSELRINLTFRTILHPQR